MNSLQRPRPTVFFKRSIFPVFGFAAAVLALLCSSAVAQPLVQTNLGGSFTFTSSVFEAAESEGTAIISVTRFREGQVYGKMLVDVVVSNGTATNGQQFTAKATNTLVFSNFQSVASFPISIRDNAQFATNTPSTIANLKLENPRPAPDETMGFTADIGSTDTAELMIYDNDEPRSFNLSKLFSIVDEGGNVEISVILPEPVPDNAQTVSVDYAITVDTGIPLVAGSDYAKDTDFVAQSGTLTFNPGDVEQIITVSSAADALIEFNEDFHIKLSNPQGTIPPPDTGGTDGGTDAGTDGGSPAPAATAGSTAGTTSGTTGGSTGGTPPPAVEENYILGAITEGTITILFNGALSHPQPSGSLDGAHNMEDSRTTIPPFNPLPGANRTVFSAAVDSTGRTIIGGEFTAYNGTPRNRVARINPDGSLDTTFVPTGGANDFVAAVATYPFGPNAGKVLIAGGFTAVNGGQRNSIARLNANGSLDTTFQPGQGANGPIYAIVIDENDNIIIGGDFSSFDGVQRSSVARLTANGQLDLTFDTGTGANGAVLAILSEVPPAFTFSSTNTGNGPATETINIDSGARSGMIEFTYNFQSSMDALAVYQGTTRIFDTGLTNNEVVITNADDTLTTNFVPRTVRIAYNGTDVNLSFIINEGSTNTPTDWELEGTVFPNLSLGIVVAGEFTQMDGIAHGRIARLTPNGSVDLNFASNIGLGAEGTINALGFLPTERKILAAGSFTAFNSLPYNNLVKLHADGTVDRNFLRAGGPNDAVWALTVAPDDRFYLGGRFSQIHETHRLGVARLFADGSVDTSFLDTAYNAYAGLPDANGLFPNGEVQAVAIEPSGDVIIGGSFNRVGGGGVSRENFRPRNNFARLIGGETAGPGNISWGDTFFGGDEASGSLIVTLVRTNGNLGDAWIGAYTIEGSATDGVDYLGGTNIFGWTYTGNYPSEGDDVPMAIRVDIIDDEEIEGDETFLVDTFSPFGDVILGGAFIPTGAAYAPPKRTRAQIIEDDTEPSVLSFELAEYDIDENGGLLTVNVNRSGNLSSSVSARYTIVSPTGPNAATAGLDYVAAFGSLTFSGGQTNKTFTIRVLDDELVEPDELVSLRLSNPSGGAELGANTNVVLTIVDNDYAPGRVSFTASDYRVTEGGNAVVTVRRRGGNIGVLRVDYRTQDDTATAPADFTHVNGTLLWNNLDSTPRTIVIPLGEDGFVEGTERFRILLSNASPVDALGSRTNSTVSILDNDFYGSFSFNAQEYLADEIGTNVIINVIRRGGSAETASVNYSTRGLTAISGQHYQDVSGTLVFGAGEVSKSFTIPILDDFVTNGERQVSIVLTNALPAGAGLLAPTNAVLSIIDNETFNIPAGSVETDFGLGGGANDTVHEVLLQSDGKIIVVGEFTAFNNELRPYIARLLPDSSLDRTFEPEFSIDGPMREAIMQSDGKILVAGDFTTIDNMPSRFIARFTRAGDPDTTFNPGSGADNPVFALGETFVGGERRLLVGGNFTVMNGVARRGVARLLENGRTDLAFDTGAGVNGTVYALAVQRDGKILIAGEFDAVNGVPRINVARLNADGSLDADFNAGLGADGSVRAITISLDDKILIAGLFSTVSEVERRGIARLNSDGTLDATFDPGSGANGPIYTLELQRDGKILLGGDFTFFQGLPMSRLARLNADGTLDSTINFGRGPNSYVTSIAVQTDRRIVIGGDFTQVDGIPRRHLARLYGGSIAGAGELQFEIAEFQVNENGTNAVVSVRRIGGLTGNVTVNYATSVGTAEVGVDYSDVSGTLTFRSGENLQTFLIPILNDDLAESVETVNLTLSSPTGGAILRRQPVATLRIISDDSIVSFAQAAYAASEGIPGGRIAIQVVREGETSFPASVNYSATAGSAGPRQPTDPIDFTPVSGQILFAAGESIKTFTVDIIEDTVVEGNETVNLTLTRGAGSNVLLGRPSAILTIIDNDFAPGILNLVPLQNPVNENAGNVTITVSRTSGRTGAVSVNYSVTPISATPGEDYQAISGTLNFADGDIARSITIPILDDEKVEGNESFQVRIQNATGGAVVGQVGTITVLINDDDLGPGSLDASFDSDLDLSGIVYDLFLQPDGKILVAGEFTASTQTAFHQNVARVNGDGSADLNFSAGQGTDDRINKIFMGTDGKSVIGGNFTQFGNVFRRYVGRLQTNGFADATFNLGAAENGEVYAVAVQPDGKIVVGGAFTNPTKGLIRLNRNGSLDVSFNPEGGVEGVVLDIALQNNSSVLVAGNFTRLGNTAVRSIARVFSNGLLDQSFQTGTGANGTVRDVDVLPEGKVLIVGDFTSYNGTPRNRVAILNADGTLDLTFNPANVNGLVNSAAADRGKVYIAGSFSQVGGTPRTRVARLNADGSLDTAFDAGVGPNGEVFDIEVQNDGQVLIGGSFTTVNGFFSPGIARLNGDAILEPVDVQIGNVQYSNGRISFTFNSEAGRSYAIETSTDLVSWETVETRVGSGSPVQFTDNTSPAGQHRFYRVRTITQ